MIVMMALLLEENQKKYRILKSNGEGEGFRIYWGSLGTRTRCAAEGRADLC